VVLLLLPPASSIKITVALFLRTRNMLQCTNHSAGYPSCAALRMICASDATDMQNAACIKTKSMCLSAGAEVAAAKQPFCV
jgi:hypothetical protein